MVANLERNELKNRVIELEENLRGKQSVMKDLNKENYELRAKLNNYESQARQEASPSPVLRRELESLQDTLRNNQKRLEEMNRENHEMRSKLAQTGHEEKSASPKIEEMEVSLQSKVQIIEGLNIQNQELSRENQTLKSRLRERSPDNSQSDSQVESLQENLKTKQTVISELNKQNQGLREKLHELSQSGSSDAQLQSYKRKISDMQSEIGLKNDELERLRAIEMSFMQAKEVMKELTTQSQKAKEQLAIMNEKFAEVTKESQQKEEQLLKRCQIGEQQLEKVQSDYHEIVTVNNDHLMKVSCFYISLTPSVPSTYADLIELNLCCCCRFSEGLISQLLSNRTKSSAGAQICAPNQSGWKMTNKVIGLTDFSSIFTSRQRPTKVRSTEGPQRSKVRSTERIWELFCVPKQAKYHL